MYRAGLGFDELGRFADHAGFDGVMLGQAGLDYHLEFTVCRAHPLAPAPTPEDLLVFYLPQAAQWESACQSVLAAGFIEVAPYNPYWRQHGRSFADHDGYRLVLQCASWGKGADV